MTLSELKTRVDAAVAAALEFEESPDKIVVSLQIDGPGTNILWASDDVRLYYDSDAQASGCVLVGSVG